MILTLSMLHHRVTETIRRADAAPNEAARKRRFYEVSYLEEQIACLTDARTIEGEAARLGVVIASIKAGKPRRAARLATQYLADTRLSDNLKTWIRAALKDVTR